MIGNGTRTGRRWTRRSAWLWARLAGVCSLAVVAVLAAAAAPAGAFVYLNEPSGVAGFSGGATGALSALGDFGPDGPSEPGPAVVSPDGNSLYVANGSDGSDGSEIFHDSVAGDGTLTVKGSGVGVPAVGNVSALAISPGGHYLYVLTSFSGTCSVPEFSTPSPAIFAGEVFQYAIGSDGAIGSAPIGSACTGPGATGVAVGPGGDTVYVSETQSYPVALPGGGVAPGDPDFGTILQLSVNKSGGLTPLSPATVTLFDGDAPWALAVSNGTVRVATTEWGVSDADSTLWTYSIEPSGALNPMFESLPGTGYITGDPVGMVVSPNGQYIYVAGDAGWVSELSAAGAVLGDNVSGIATGSGSEGIAITPDGHYVYVANDDGTISQFSVGTGGALTKVSPPPSDPPITVSGGAGIVADQLQSTLSANDYQPLTLTLTAGVSNTPLAGQTLTFTAGGQSCTTTTNASGQAEKCENNSAAQTSGFKVTYAGDADYLPSSTMTLPLDQLAPPQPVCSSCQPPVNP